MLPDDPWNNWWIKAACYALFAAFGGIMGHLMRTIETNGKISWARAAMEGFAAGFVGLIVMMVCQALELNDLWTGVIVGVLGWLGANVSIKLLETVVRRKLGIDRMRETANDRPTGNS